MHFSSLRRVSLISVLLVPLGACDSVTSPGTAALEVRLSSQVGASAALAPSFLIATDEFAAAMGPIALEDVESILVEITDVLVQPIGTEESEDETHGWVSLDRTGADTEIEVDLINLADVQTIGVLPGHTGLNGIAAVRIVFGEATITVNGEAHPLFIPSGKVTIATPGLQAEDGEVLELVFLQDASVQKVILTGAGYLMPPVIRPANEVEEEAEV